MTSTETTATLRNVAPSRIHLLGHQLNTQIASTIFVVDNDVSAREPLELLLRTAGWEVQTFASGHEFLARPRIAATPSCLILDVSLPDFSGLELQRQIASERRDIPVIFISSCCDFETIVKAMKAGAVDFLTKPFNPQSVLNATREAIKRSEIVHNRESELDQLRAGYRLLTPREREVLTLIVSGMANKQVGGELGITEITVKMHRGNVMRKMKADSFAQLVNMASRLRVARSVTPSAVFA
jgi:FixJ family two-component response regulator